MAGINIASNFNLGSPLPLDDRFVFDDTANRDLLSSSRRYEGLICYVKSDQTYYLLKGGIDNLNWIAMVTEDEKVEVVLSNTAPVTNNENVFWFDSSVV